MARALMWVLVIAAGIGIVLMLGSPTPPKPGGTSAGRSVPQQLLEEVIDGFIQRIRGNDSTAPLTEAEARRLESMLAAINLNVPKGTIAAGSSAHDAALATMKKLSPAEQAQLPGLLSLSAPTAKPSSTSGSSPAPLVDDHSAELRVNGVVMNAQKASTTVFQPGDRLESAGPIHYPIRTPDATMELQQESSLTVKDNEVYLGTGQVLFRTETRTPAPPRGFRVMTPHAEILDIGTTFVVTAEPRRSRCEVLYGKVLMRSLKYNSTVDLLAGDYAWTDDDGVLNKQAGDWMLGVTPTPQPPTPTPTPEITANNSQIPNANLPPFPTPPPTPTPTPIPSPVASPDAVTPTPTPSNPTPAPTTANTPIGAIGGALGGTATTPTPTPTPTTTGVPITPTPQPTDTF